MTYVDRLIDAWFTRIQRSTHVPEWHSSIFRIFVGCFLMVYGIPSFAWIAQAPDGFFNPPLLSFARLASGFPPQGLLQVIDVLLVLAVVCITLGIRARIASWLFVVLYLYGASFTFSFGKIDHTIMVPTTILCFSFSNWATLNALVPDKRLEIHNQSIALQPFFLAVAMFIGGFEKILWVDFNLNTGGFLNWYYDGYSLQRDALLADTVYYFPALLTELMDYSAVALELVPFLCLWMGRRWWKTWLLVACIFHLMNVLLLNIPFTEHVMVYAPYFFYPLIANTATDNRTGPSRAVRVIFGIFTICAAIQVFLIVRGGLQDYIFAPSYSEDKIASLLFALSLWIIISLFGIASLIRDFAPRKNQLNEVAEQSED